MVGRRHIRTHRHRRAGHKMSALVTQNIAKNKSFQVERNVGNGRYVKLYTDFKLVGVYSDKTSASKEQDRINHKFASSKLKVHTRKIKVKDGYAVYAYRSKS